MNDLRDLPTRRISVAPHSLSIRLTFTWKRGYSMALVFGWTIGNIYNAIF